MHWTTGLPSHSEMPVGDFPGRLGGQRARLLRGKQWYWAGCGQESGDPEMTGH